MTPASHTTDLVARAALVMGGAHLARLRSLGLDVVEAARQGALVEDADGREYVDCVCGRGIFNLGRRPEGVLAALRAAVETTDQGNFPLISTEKADFAQRLAAFVPGELECCIFSVSRGEALDAACKLARAHTRRAGLLTVDGGWYGETGFALSLSERRDKTEFAPLIPDVRSIPMNDLAAAQAAISRLDAAFVLEPVQAENGCRVVDPSYLRSVARICRDRGVLLILDETQSGMGRTGARFAYAHWGLVPDLLVVGESVAAGAFPICATLFPARLQVFLNEHPLIHLSTFGGSDVGCLVGQRALDEYEARRPWENAAAMGERLRSALAVLVSEHHDQLDGCDGLGLLLALHLGGDEKARAFCRALAANGVLALPGRVAEASVVLRPSLLLTEAEADRIVAACSAALAALKKPAARRRSRAASADGEKRPAVGAGRARSGGATGTGGSRRPAAAQKPATGGSRKPAAAKKPAAGGSRKPAAAQKPATGGSRKPAAAPKKPAAAPKKPAAAPKKPAAAPKKPATGGEASAGATDTPEPATRPRRRRSRQETSGEQ